MSVSCGGLIPHDCQRLSTRKGHEWSEAVQRDDSNDNENGCVNDSNSKSTLLRLPCPFCPGCRQCPTTTQNIHEKKEVHDADGDDGAKPKTTEVTMHTTEDRKGDHTPSSTGGRKSAFEEHIRRCRNDRW
uniref:Uncharacterized protein n=1 Tax=Craspedostauros australis TaxID=1486917 RepID=A0A7R9WRI4_9STRA|mmetsp:Transcript_15084/g.41760  ORF Transcript_15084/g.41760 Transcript_15084/m.41760 type:complete len:130 (+) Transcript_15084:268-657(+)